MLSEGTFDLLVLDDHLSDKNAIEVMSELRSSGMTPMVVVTYHRDPSAHQRAQLRSLGASALVNKRAPRGTRGDRRLLARGLRQGTPRIRHHDLKRGRLSPWSLRFRN